MNSEWLNDQALRSYGDRVDPPYESDDDFEFKCPVCDRRLDFDEDVVMSNDGEVIGCEYCTITKPAGDLQS